MGGDSAESRGRGKNKQSLVNGFPPSLLNARDSVGRLQFGDGVAWASFLLRYRWPYALRPSSCMLRLSRVVAFVWGCQSGCR
jgi:hypothetical protein